MKHKIDPTNDYVVKVLFSRPQKASILIHFLNSVIDPAHPIVEVFIQDPHKHRQTENDKLSIADSLAKDTQGNLYQVEIQNSSPIYLGARITFTSHAIYANQLDSGQSYDHLNPIHSIWVLNSNMFGSQYHQHLLEIKDHKTKAELPHSKFYIIELAKWQPEIPLEQMSKEQLLSLQPIEYWLYFIKEAKNWNSLPGQLNHVSILVELMDILKEISDREENYARYLSSQDAMRVKLTEEHLRQKAEAKLAEQNEQLAQNSEQLSQQNEQLSQQSEQLSQQSEQLSQQSEQLSQQSEQLNKYREKLIAAGINPDEI